MFEKFQGVAENIWYTTGPTMEDIMNIKIAITRVHDSFTVNMYENGFMVEISGEDYNQDLITQKIIARDVNELTALVDQIARMDRAN